MNKKNKKILFTIILIIVILCITGGIITYMYIKTDMFKSSQVLFNKYISQEILNIKKLSESKISEVKTNIKSQDLYETNTTVDFKISEGGEVSNPINDLSFKFKTQKDNEYVYKDSQVFFGDESYLQIERIKESEIYGIRFSNGLKEFLSIRNTEEGFKNIDGIGLTEKQLESIIEFINGNEIVANQIISKEERENISSKYLNIIKENFNNASYSKVNNALITVNNSTLKTNAYIAKLDSNQVKTLIEQILNMLKNDETILLKLNEYNIDDEMFISKINNILDNLGIDKQLPDIQITVYEYDGNTVRTTIESANNKINIENFYVNNDRKLNIDVENNDSENLTKYNIVITKNNMENEENYNAIIKCLDNENEYTLELNIGMKKNNENINIFSNLKSKIGITEFEIDVNENTNTTQISEKISLDQTNNVILTDLSKDTRDRIIGIVKDGLPKIINERLNELFEKLKINQLIQDLINKNLGENQQTNEEDPVEEIPNADQIEVNRFNAKFEFYTGEEVSAENVKKLLEVVKLNLNSVENLETGEIKLNIEKDKQNIEQIQLISNQIEDNKKYKVSISYKDSNGIIDYIKISKIEK